MHRGLTEVVGGAIRSGNVENGAHPIRPTAEPPIHVLQEVRPVGRGATVVGQRVRFVGCWLKCPKAVLVPQRP